MLNFGVFNLRSQMPNCPQERLSWFTLPLAGCERSYLLPILHTVEKKNNMHLVSAFLFFLTFANSSGKHTRTQF